jgi:hypothetical protein
LRERRIDLRHRIRELPAQRRDLCREPRDLGTR